MLARTATVVAATQTAVADTLATAEALDASLSPTVAALTSSGTLAMFGPADKALTHNVDNKLIETLWADGTTGDFIAEARFTNPFDPNVGRWDYGFIFRDDTTQFYQLAVFADASWVLNLRSTSGEKLDIVNSGQLSNLQTGEGATNTLKLVASGAEGYLIVNDKVVGALNLAAHQVSGVVKAVTGIYSGDEVDGHTTQVTAFTVRRFDRPREWPVQLSDDFSSNANAWGEGTSEDNFAVVNRSFTDGTYHVDIQAKSSVFYRTQIQRDLGNRFLIGIDVQLLSGAADQTNYDLVFRYNADGSGGVSYYTFGVSDALTYRVDRYSDGAWTNLQSQTTSSAIKPGAINRLEVAGQDGVYSFFINGEQVTTISDTQLTGGKVGLGVSVFKSGSNGVFSFDNFELREP
jgi:hypothetical protein